MPDAPQEQKPVNCPNCQRQLDSTAVASGQRFACAGCQRIVRALRLDDGADFTLIEYFTSVCTDCLERQHVRVAYAGMRVICIHCGQEFVASREDADNSESSMGDLEIGSSLNLGGPEPSRGEINTEREKLEQVETSLQIERRANVATLEELLSVRHDRELMRTELQQLRERLSAREIVVEEMAEMARDLEQARLELDRLQLECQSAWQQLEQLQAEKQEALERFAEAFSAPEPRPVERQTNPQTRRHVVADPLPTWQSQTPPAARQETMASGSFAEDAVD
jgi:hypothetical protein